MPGRTITAAQVARIKQLRTSGWNAIVIGHALNIPESTVRNWWNAGECVDCGNPTDRSSAGGSDRCEACSRRRQHAQRYWTRERVIDAMQRFAAAYGRPPKAHEWRAGDSVRGYPPASQCYQSAAHPNSPFPSWADALEAAGFPKPRQGQHGTWRSREQIIAELRTLSTNGVAPKSPSHTALTNSATKYFGSWTAACHAAGLRTFRETYGVRGEMLRAAA